MGGKIISEEFISMLMGWMPLIIFILVWAYLARRYQGKNSSYTRFLARSGEYYSEHISEMKLLNAKLDKLIDVLEKKQP